MKKSQKVLPKRPTYDLRSHSIYEKEERCGKTTTVPLYHIFFLLAGLLDIVTDFLYWSQVSVKHDKPSEIMLHPAGRVQQLGLICTVFSLAMFAMGITCQGIYWKAVYNLCQTKKHSKFTESDLVQAETDDNLNVEFPAFFYGLNLMLFVVEDFMLTLFHLVSCKFVDPLSPGLDIKLASLIGTVIGVISKIVLTIPGLVEKSRKRKRERYNLGKKKCDVSYIANCLILTSMFIVLGMAGLEINNSLSVGEQKINLEIQIQENDSQAKQTHIYPLMDMHGIFKTQLNSKGKNTTYFRARGDDSEVTLSCKSLLESYLGDKTSCIETPDCELKLIFQFYRDSSIVKYKILHAGQVVQDMGSDGYYLGSCGDHTLTIPSNPITFSHTNLCRPQRKKD